MRKVEGKEIYNTEKRKSPTQLGVYGALGQQPSRRWSVGYDD